MLAGAAAVVVGNTGAAHLAAAVGTPVVSLFAPVVPADRWAPYRVPHVLLGDQHAPLPGTPRPRLPGARPPLPGRRSTRTTTCSTPCARWHSARRGGAGMNVLLWHVHGSWTTAFVQGPHRYLLPTLPERGPWGGGRPAAWDWPRDGRRGSPEELADEPTSTSWCCSGPRSRAGRALAGPPPGRDVPAVFLEHNAPAGDGAATAGTRWPTATTCCSCTSPTSTS